MQPVIVLMSSYRNRKRLSFNSSIILKQTNKESKCSTCTVDHEYKGVCSCHSSSSTWFCTQPGDGRKAIWTFSEPFLKYSSGHRWRSCIQDQGCKGPQEGWAPSPDQFRQVEGCVPRRPLRLPLIPFLPPGTKIWTNENPLKILTGPRPDNPEHLTTLTTLTTQGGQTNVVTPKF